VVPGQKGFARRYMNRRKSSEKQLEIAYQKAIRQAMSASASGISGRGVSGIASEKRITAIFRNSTKASYRTVIRNGFTFALEDVQELYGKPLPVLVEKELTPDDLAMLGYAATEKVILEESMTQVVTMSKTVRTKLVLEYHKATKLGESTAQIVRRFQSGTLPGGTPNWMAKRIAQTETTRAFNQATHDGYLKSSVVSKRQWITTSSNPRDAHAAAAAGPPVPLGKPFIVDGEELMYPGDSSGSPENVIGCQCGEIPVIGKFKPSAQPTVAPKPIPKPTPKPSVGGTNYISTDHTNLSGDFYDLKTLPQVVSSISQGKVVPKSPVRAPVLNIINDFTTSSGFLRKAYKSGRTKKLAGKTLTYAEQQSFLLQDTVAQKTLRKGTTLHRGMGFTKYDFDEFYSAANGGSFELQAMSSFSKSSKIAKEFAGKGEYQVIVHTKSNGNLYGLDISSVASLPDEREVILAAGQKFKVTKIEETSKGILNMWVDSVPVLKKSIAKAAPKESLTDLMDKAFDKPLSIRKK